MAKHALCLSKLLSLDKTQFGMYGLCFLFVSTKQIVKNATTGVFGFKKFLTDLLRVNTIV